MEKFPDSLGQYEWMSVGDHVRWLEVQCGITPFSGESVHSMRITQKGGVAGLLSTKIRVYDRLHENIRLVEEQELELEQDSYTAQIVSVIRNNMQFALGIVTGQIDTLKAIAKVGQGELIYVPIRDDEIPF